MLFFVEKIFCEFFELGVLQKCVTKSSVDSDHEKLCKKYIDLQKSASMRHLLSALHVSPDFGIRIPHILIYRSEQRRHLCTHGRESAAEVEADLCAKLTHHSNLSPRQPF